MAKKTKIIERNVIPIEAFNYDFSRDYPFSDFLEELQKEGKALEKQGFTYVWLMPELPFYGHPEESTRYRLFALNPKEKTILKDRHKPQHKELRNKNGKEKSLF